MRKTPPKPPSRPDNASLRERIALFRKDMFRSQPERLYRAKMARLKTPFFKSVLVNEPGLVRTVLEKRPSDFPKSRIIGSTLRALLGRSVFVTNGDLWERQRRMIDPAFEAGRLRESFAAMEEAGQLALSRLEAGEVELEFETAHLAADVIFRTLFSIPITQDRAREVFEAFRDYQREQPLLSWVDLMKAPFWVPRRKRGQGHARKIRSLLEDLVRARQKEIDDGLAPDDLATKIMNTQDPETGARFTVEEMVDQVAIFFLAGHETSASALSWGLYCLSLDPPAQEEIVQEVARVAQDRPLSFGDISKLRFTRDVFKEVLRLYPPVPMMVRETAKREVFRKTELPKGSLCIVSPWHIQRHETFWDRGDVFDPWRWGEDATKACARDAYLPFSKGARVCSGAGFATLEGVLFLAMFVRAFEIVPSGTEPLPVAHLTVRSENGIRVVLRPRR